MRAELLELTRHRRVPLPAGPAAERVDQLGELLRVESPAADTSFPDRRRGRAARSLLRDQGARLPAELVVRHGQVVLVVLVGHDAPPARRGSFSRSARSSSSNTRSLTRESGVRLEASVLLTAAAVHDCLVSQQAAGLPGVHAAAGRTSSGGRAATSAP